MMIEYAKIPMRPFMPRNVTHEQADKEMRIGILDVRLISSLLFKIHWNGKW